MMLYLAALSLALCVAFVVILIGSALPARSRAVKDRLAEVGALGMDPYSAGERHRRQRLLDQVLAFLEVLGTKLGVASVEGGDRAFLAHAGYRSSGAVPVFWGLRLALGLGLAVLVTVTAPLLRVPAVYVLLASIYMGAVGYVAPVFWVRARRSARQRELTKALPDALDLLVVCVEAGLGLNQAFVRVAEEIRYVSRLMAQELALVNAEIRAGAARDMALRGLADRTGLEDIRSLVTMLIQTDRFGTSVGRALRVHADTMRQKRRQRAEEAAAKTTIKLVFPLVLFIFPAMFVVLLGPGLIMIFRALSGLQ